MANAKENPVKRLAELLRDADVEVTFSQWCISGLVRDCACWRCLKERGIEATEETEKAAKERSKRESEAFRQRTMEFIRKVRS